MARTSPAERAKRRSAVANKMDNSPIQRMMNIVARGSGLGDITLSGSSEIAAMQKKNQARRATYISKGRTATGNLGGAEARSIARESADIAKLASQYESFTGGDSSEFEKKIRGGS